MHVLLVAATGAEIAPVLAGLGPGQAGPEHTTRQQRAGHEVDVLITGVGMVATAARCARILAGRRYDLAVNLGVCGAFDRSLAPGTVVHVVSDGLPELGAEDGEAFLTIQQLGLLDADEFPFRGGRLWNASPPANPVLERLPAVAGITVNTVHGDERSIDSTLRRFGPQVESMEGAAFMYACLLADVRFAQVRAVSNLVERRNREAWALPESIRNLGETALALLDRA